jgi:DNA replication protein DnaC
MTPEEIAEQDRKREERFRAEDERRAKAARLAEVEKLARKIGERYKPNRVDLANFQIYDPKQKAVVENVRRLAARIRESVEAGENVIFVGSVGVGKDHLMAWLMYQAAPEFTCHWANGQDIFGAFRDRIDTGESDESAFRMFSNPQILAISDPIPPAGGLGNWDVGNLYRIIDQRYRSMKPIWISVNAQDAADLESRLSSPVFDRVRDGAIIFPCFWASFRGRAKG